jgi:hypothetical protein
MVAFYHIICSDDVPASRGLGSRARRQICSIFKNPIAAVDGLAHRSIILEFYGESFRAKAAKDSHP